MQNIRKNQSTKKRQIPCGLPGLKMYIDYKPKDQFKQQNNNNPVKVFNNGRFNQVQQKHKPYSGNPNVKFNHYGNYKQNPTRIPDPKQPHRGISSANPNLSSKLFYNSPPNKLQKNNPLCRSLPKSNIPSHINIQINHSINLNKYRESVALPYKYNIDHRRTPVGKNKMNNNNYYNNSNKANAIIKSCVRSQSKQSNRESIKRSIKEFYSQEEENFDHRKSMEDFHQIVDGFCNDKSKTYFAIFDGHSGKEPARYCKDNLHHILSKNLYLNNFNVEKSLHDTFHKIDCDLKKKLQAHDSGTTATVAVIIQETNARTKVNQTALYCANVGDSKGFLISKSGRVNRITTDHKCSDSSEVDRIKKSGGVVFSGRVFGTLALTRTLGDIEMKNYGVLCTPSISKHIINDDSLYVIIASDGVWDVVEENDLAQYSKNNISAESFCNQLIKLSMERDSRDNISCVVIKL